MRTYGMRILTSLSELKLEDARLFRILANKLTQEGEFQKALFLLRRVSKLKSEEPQTWRELGLAYRNLSNYETCLTNLWKVVVEEWPVRFQHIEDEVLIELNHTIFLAKKHNIAVDTAPYTRFLKEMPMDLHSTIFWDVDDLCIDLHIHEPGGTHCYYGCNQTSIGGWSSPDYSGCTAYSTSMLREYMIIHARKGSYKLKCNYFSNYRSDLIAGSIMWFTIYSNYCRDNETVMQATMRIDAKSDRSDYDIGHFDVS